MASRKLLEALPRGIRAEAIRRLLHLEYEVPAGVIFKLAETRDELEGAFRLLHDTYVSEGFMKPHASRLRVTPYHALPTTSTLIAKKDGQVIATVSIIRDNVFGLPMERVFDTSPIRSQDLTVAEISSLAVDKDYRESRGAVLFPLYRFLYLYCAEFFGIDCMMIAVNPKHIELYESVILFERLAQKPVEKYEFANGAPAVGAYLDLGTIKNRLLAAYGSAPSSRNLFAYSFLADRFVGYQFPNRPYFKTSDPVMTPALLEHFFVKRTQLFHSMSGAEQSVLRKIYDRFPEHRDLIPRSNVEVPFLRTRNSTRYEVSCFGQIHARATGQVLSMSVRDVSSRGFQCRLTQPLEPGSEVEFSIQVSAIRVLAGRARCSWSVQTGICGFEIIEAGSDWKAFLKYLEVDFRKAAA